MRRFEYMAIPAPTVGTKARGLKGTDERFARSLTEALNGMAEDGWEYVRAESLPCEERKGLTGTQSTWQNMLVFRRLAETGRTGLPPLPLQADEIDDVPPMPVVPRRVSTYDPDTDGVPQLGPARED